MNEQQIRLRRVGINFNNDGLACILLWAPGAETVEIFLPLANRKLPLAKGQFGYWSLQTGEVKPGDEYLFVLNGTQKLPDPASLSQPTSVYGPSKALDLKSFQWNDQSWVNPDLNDYIIYELHVGTFSAEGDFAGVEKHLDYLVDLGITAIELMPVAQFPGERNWGYDGVFPFAVQHGYGGAEALQHLVQTCHYKGIAVILDVVFNHLGPEGNHLEHFAPYFTDKYKTPWGNALNFDDTWSDGVRAFFIENALMWFRDFHIDALRMDAVHAIRDFGPVHILQEIKEQTDALIRQTERVHYLIVESDLNDTKFINPIQQGGFGMDAQWSDEFHHALRVSAGQERSGYYSDFDGLASLAKAYQDAYVYDGTYSEHRKRKFGTSTTGNAGEQFVVFSQNHDQVGNRMLGERTSQLVEFEMQKLLAGAVLVSPYLPLLFMGEEYGETNPFLYFVSHTDPELAEAVRKGRKKEFEAFHIEGEMVDPMSEEAFKMSRLQWERIAQEPHQWLLSFYMNLIALRKTNPALRLLNRKECSVTYLPEQQTIVLHRRHESHEVVCLLHFSKENQQVGTTHYAPKWLKLLASGDKRWGGPMDVPDQLDEVLTLVLPPQSITIYTNENV